MDEMWGGIFFIKPGVGSHKRESEMTAAAEQGTLLKLDLF